MVVRYEVNRGLGCIVPYKVRYKVNRGLGYIVPYKVKYKVKQKVKFGSVI